MLRLGLYRIEFIGIMRASIQPNPRPNTMSDQNDSKYNDGTNDAIAATAIIALVVLTVVYWLSGMPS